MIETTVKHSNTAPLDEELIDVACKSAMEGQRLTTVNVTYKEFAGLLKNRYGKYVDGGNGEVWIGFNGPAGCFNVLPSHTCSEKEFVIGTETL